MKSRRAWFGRGLGANSTGWAAPPLGWRAMREAVALGAQRRAAAGRSSLRDVVLGAGVRPSGSDTAETRGGAEVSGAEVSDPAGLTPCAGVAAGELESRAASPDRSLPPSKRCSMGAETVGKGHSWLPA